tara:strand:+ start:1625 stop:1831 length:207 start_codon:yes stop_codon:yes gene_type:complete
MIKADDSQIWEGDLGDERGISVPLFISLQEVLALLVSYDPEDKYSPSAAESREIARVLLDALKAFLEE